MRILAGVTMMVMILSPAGLWAEQGQPQVGPPLAEVEARWTAFWTHVVDGNLTEARRYIHSSRRHFLPDDKGLAHLQDLAVQMAFCRLDPTPILFAPGEVMYRVHCRHGDETAETLIGLRKDFDGVWRFILL